MNRIVVIGEPGRTRGFRLAGATVMEADGPAELDRAWTNLPSDTTLLILTHRAADRLRDPLSARSRLPWAVMPE